jgi:hypothetical protein
MFISAFFTLTKISKQPRCPTTDEWIIRKCGIYIQCNFIQPKKKNKILSFVGKWMELENIILSKVKIQKARSICFLSYVEYIPNTNTELLQKISQTKEKSLMSGIG